MKWGCEVEEECKLKAERRDSGVRAAVRGQEGHGTDALLLN